MKFFSKLTWAVFPAIIPMLLVSCGAGETGAGADQDTEKEVFDPFAKGTSSGGDVDREKTVDPDRFIAITPGTFLIGSPPTENGRCSIRETQHPVTLTYPYEIQSTETTIRQFQKRVAKNHIDMTACGSDCPANMVIWDEALVLANALSREKGLPECFACLGQGWDSRCSLKPEYAIPQQCLGYRLPTEAEWEFAARAGETGATCNGEYTDISDICTPSATADPIGWHCGNGQTTYSGCYDMSPDKDSGPSCIGIHEAGQKAVNAWGLYDTLGNVVEWVWDWYEPFEAEPKTDPAGPKTGEFRMRKGGSWFNSPMNLRFAVREEKDPLNHNWNTGFRLARTLRLPETTADGDGEGEMEME